MRECAVSSLRFESTESVVHKQSDVVVGEKNKNTTRRQYLKHIMSLSDLREKNEKFKIPRRLDDNNPYYRSKTVDCIPTSSQTTRTRSSSIPGPFDNLATSSSISLHSASPVSPRPDEEEQKLRKMGERSRNFAQILKDMLKEEKEEGSPGEHNRKPKKREGGFFSNSTTKILTKKRSSRTELIPRAGSAGAEELEKPKLLRSPTKENGVSLDVPKETLDTTKDNNDSERNHTFQTLAESAPAWRVNPQQQQQPPQQLLPLPNTDDDPVTAFKTILTERANKLAIQVTSVQSRLLTFDDGEPSYNPEKLEKEAIKAANIALLTLKEIVNITLNPPAVVEGGVYSKEEWLVCIFLRHSNAFFTIISHLQ